MAAAAALISAALIVVLHPLLARYALARPTARSSHTKPTPQGGGIAVIAAMTLVIAGALMLFPGLFDDPRPLAGALAAVLGLALVGVTDDVRPLAALPRLVLQAAAVTVVLATLPAEMRVVPALPWWLERALLLIGGVWFVNLTNFMDGIDWMTVAEVVPVTAALALFGADGRAAAGRDRGVLCAVRRHARLRAVQPAGGAAVPGRRRQPADRPGAGLAADPARRPRPSLRRAAAAALLRWRTRPSRFCAGSSKASRSCRRTAATIFSARPTGAWAFGASSRWYLRSTWCYASWPRSLVVTTSGALHSVLLAIGIVCVAALLIKFNGGYRPKA